ncbi:MAG: hypothetical protein ABIA37_05310 [Candidatus Woesearchaeota archaeon]
MNAEKLTQKARKDIGKFCMEECKAYCCRKGYLVLTTSQAELITHQKEAVLKDNLTLKLINGNYSLNLHHDCPALHDCKCDIHTKRNRPLACKQFPIFIDGMNVRLSHRCLAVKNGLFYPYVSKMLSLGYKVSESDPFYDSECYSSKDNLSPTS